MRNKDHDGLSQITKATEKLFSGNITRRELLTGTTGVILGGATLLAANDARAAYNKAVTEGPQNFTGGGKGTEYGGPSFAKPKKEKERKARETAFLEKYVFTSGKDGSNRPPETKLSYWQLGQSKAEALKSAQSRAVAGIQKQSGPKYEKRVGRKGAELYTFTMSLAGKSRFVSLHLQDNKVVGIKLTYSSLLGDPVDESVLKYLDRTYGKGGETAKYKGNSARETVCKQMFGSSQRPVKAVFKMIRNSSGGSPNYRFEMSEVSLMSRVSR